MSSKNNLFSVLDPNSDTTEPDFQQEELDDWDVDDSKAKVNKTKRKKKKKTKSKKEISTIEHDENVERIELDWITSTGGRSMVIEHEIINLGIVEPLNCTICLITPI